MKNEYVMIITWRMPDDSHLVDTKSEYDDFVEATKDAAKLWLNNRPGVKKIVVRLVKYEDVAVYSEETTS